MEEMKKKVGDLELEAGELQGKIVVYKGATMFGGRVNRIGMITGLKECDKRGIIVPWQKEAYPNILQIRTLEGTVTEVRIESILLVIPPEEIYSLAEQRGFKVVKKAFPE